jgi:hypothetical protein
LSGGREECTETACPVIVPYTPVGESLVISIGSTNPMKAWTS